MEVVGVIALGAGAFITTTVAATLLIHRAAKHTSSDDEWVHVDLAEKGLGDGLDDDAEVYQAKRGEGWKEYMVETGSLAPLVLHDEMTAPTVARAPSRARTPLFPERLFPTPPRWQPLPALPTVPQDNAHIPQAERSPAPVVPLLEAPEDVSEHVDQAPDINMTSVAGAEVPLPVDVPGPSEADDALPTGIISWPAMFAPVQDAEAPVSPTEPLAPVEETPPEPVDTEPVVQLELTSPTPPTLSPISLSVQTLDLGLDIKSPVIQDEERIIPILDLKSPVVDSTNPFQSPASHSPLEDDLLPPPPVYTRYDTAKSPIDPKLVETLLSPVARQTVNIFITSHMDDQDVFFAARVPLPMSIPSTPKPALIVDEWPLMVDTKESRGFGVSDDVLSPKTPFVTSLTLVIPPVVVSSIPGSPVSDDDSDSSLSSTPTSPTELKQLSPSTELLPTSKGTPASPTTEPEDDIITGQVTNIPDNPGEPTPDPPEPTLALVPFLPGSFDPPTAAQAAANVSLMTGDVFQLCRALLAVSNCAGLVAQFMVGFSMWWSLVFMPI
ncbi:hypothetical protein FRC08_001401 [Ceratobasidium sp. 394]|nr:hypothetical protein FRC08_001401 [Ceratobasidium sp. 394]